MKKAENLIDEHAASCYIISMQRGTNMPTPRNFVAKYMNEVNRGGRHQDRRRKERSGRTKHKEDYRSSHFNNSKSGE